MSGADAPAGRILVTGATGNIGPTVLAYLRARGVPVRIGAYDPTPVAGGEPTETTEVVRLDLTDPTTFAPALEGVDRVFLLRPPAIARVGPTLNAFLDAAVTAGVTYVVFVSVAGAERNRIVPHHRVETHLAASDLGWTVLRPGFFAQNLTTAYLEDLRTENRLHVPAGDGEVAFVDTRDVGEVAAQLLVDPTGHLGRGYTLTGPRAVTFTEVAELLTDVLGRPIRYEPASVLGYLRHLGRRQLPVAQRVVQTVLHVGLRRGDAATVDPTLAQLLGRPARDLAAFLSDHRELLDGPGAR